MSFKVRENRKYLKHLVEELHYCILVGYNNLEFNREGLVELENWYENKIYNDVVSFETKSSLRISLEWLVGLLLDFSINAFPVLKSY